MENKNSFILYCDIIHTVEKMPNEKAGELFKHILNYVNDNDPVTDDLLIQVVFEPIKQSLKRALKKWQATSARRSEIGRLGGLKSGEARASKPNQNEAIASATKQNEATSSKRTVSDSVSVSVSVIDSVSNNKREVKKTLEERKSAFASSLSEFKDKYPRPMLKNFHDYWTETNRSKNNMRFELEKTWEVGLRLAKWASKEKGFSIGQPSITPPSKKTIEELRNS